MSKMNLFISMEKVVMVLLSPKEILPHSFFDIGSIGHDPQEFKGNIDVKEVLVFKRRLLQEKDPH